VTTALLSAGLWPCQIEEILVRDGEDWRFAGGVQFQICGVDGGTHYSGGWPIIYNGRYGMDPVTIEGEPAGAWFDGERRYVLAFKAGLRLAHRRLFYEAAGPRILVACKDAVDENGSIDRSFVRPFQLW
jgi:hypothetical protein